jgi:hypothetical protein
MLKTVVAMCAFFGMMSATVEKNEVAKFNWDSQTIDVGQVTAGEAVTATFVFENTGDQPLVIHEAKAPCGCTVASFTKEAIKPGGKGEVKVVYDAKKAGAFSKSVKVKANTEEGYVDLTIKGEVVANS